MRWRRIHVKMSVNDTTYPHSLYDFDAEDCQNTSNIDSFKITIFLTENISTNLV